MLYNYVLIISAIIKRKSFYFKILLLCLLIFLFKLKLSAQPGGYGVTNDPAVTPKRTAALAGVKIPTNDWWTSLAWGYYSGNFSGELYADPLSFQTNAAGLGVRGQQNPSIYPYDYYYDDNTSIPIDFTVGLVGLNVSGTNVDAFSDWTVTADWNDGTRNLKAIIGHGLPFAYFTRSNTTSNAEINLNNTPSAVWGSGNAYGVTINGVHYGFFAPTGSTWTGVGTNNWRSTLNNQLYFSIALLPDNSLATLNFYRNYAFAFVTNSQVSWSYNSSTAMLTTTYTATVTAREAGQTTPLLALYRHQWLNTSNAFTSYSYPKTARGEMKVIASSSFSTDMKFNGVLPAMPKHETTAAYITNLEGYINGAVAGPPAGDCYNAGKWLGRLAQLVQLAEQQGAATSARFTSFLNSMKTEMQDWFTAGGKEFRYNSTWGILSPSSDIFGERTQVNDHHFHYGYFIHAAAIIARYDQAWASTSSSGWGGMVETLIKDVANWDVVADNRFPRLRSFDPYAGHSWANGHGSGWMGNDQESTSESINFSTGLILWGANTCNQTIRDLGIYLYTNEVAAIEQYWFDINNIVFPTGYNQNVISILRGNGGQYAIHWDPPGNNVSEIHGINLLPITGGSLYLGKNPGYINTFLSGMHSGSDMGGINGVWRDIFWAYEAFSQSGTYNAAAAVARFNANSGYTPEVGESKAHTYHWINNLNKLGQLHTVNGNIPTSATFIKSGTICYVAYNPPCNSTITVNFSNGASMSVAPNELKVMCNLTLPVELISFDLAYISSEKAVHLKWITASEKDNAGFLIYRKEEGAESDYGLISGYQNNSPSIKGVNGNFSTSYSYVDRSVIPGKSYYYKLVNVDFDGKTYDHVKHISTEGSLSVQLRNYPNPASEETFIEFSIPDAVPSESVRILIMDTNGKVITELENLNTHSDMYQKVLFNTKDLCPGIYFYSLLVNGQILETNYMVVIH